MFLKFIWDNEYLGIKQKSSRKREVLSEDYYCILFIIIRKVLICYIGNRWIIKQNSESRSRHKYVLNLAEPYCMVQVIKWQKFNLWRISLSTTALAYKALLALRKSVKAPLSNKLLWNQSPQVDFCRVGTRSFWFSSKILQYIVATSFSFRITLLTF